MKRKFLYFLTDAAGQCYRVENGVVKKAGTLKELPENPDGWNNKVVNFARNSTYYGIFRSFSVPLKFVKTGAHILRNILFKLGIEAVVNLIILRFNANSGTHEGFYKGEVDFSKAQSDKDYFQATILEGGFVKYLKAYESTTYEIPLEGADVVDVTMDGLLLQKSVKFMSYDSESDDDFHTVPLVVVSEEGTSFGVLSGESPVQDTSGYDPATNDDRWILKCVGDPVTVTLTGNFDFRIGSRLGSISQNMRVFFVKSTGEEYTIFNQGVAESTDYTADVNLTITLNTGDRLFMHGERTGSTNVKMIYKDSTSITAKFNTRYKTTTIKAIKASAVGEKLIKNMAGNDYSLLSTALANCDIYLTCGDAIRGLTSPVPKLKTSFKNYFASFNRNLCLGMSINNKQIEIEKRSNYYKSNVVYDGGEVANAEFSVEDSILINSIKVGYAAQEYDDVNGREEFNNTHEYKAPITRVNKQLDLTAPYRADMYGIEFLRINLDGKTTTDSDSDNDIFMLVVERDPVANDGSYRLKREAYDSITGLIDSSSAFNIQLSPKRILQAHGAWIRSLMWPYDGEKLTFQTTQKNSSLKTVKGSEIIEEKADVVIGTLPTPYFLPITVKFETLVPDNLISIMETNGHGKFKFKYRGKPFTVWIEESSQKPADRASQVWKGLLCAENDLETLIH